MRARALAIGVVMIVGALALSGCRTGSTLGRVDAPEVLTGSQVPALIGAPPSRVVAFAYVTVDNVPQWEQIPVQIDERKVVGFGTAPANNTTAGTTGTVYGSGTSAITQLQYTDPQTWVGADSDTSFDTDDELVFMTADAGGPRPDGSADPAGVVAGSGVRVALTNPSDSAKVGYVYLYRSTGTLVPSAGRDYVNYAFNLTSGDYKTTYKRSDGPNPETSKVTTANYEIEYPDRWYETSWKLKGSGTVSADLLDGVKNQFALNYCGRSNATFADAEGAFIVNKDGPVRGIRSYVGANSGPMTQRTHLMYRDQEVVVTDLRVHAIPGVMDYVDYSSAAVGMTYRSETAPGGAPVDGVGDSVPTSLTRWEAVSGPQGLVMTNTVYESSIPGFDSKVSWYHEDNAAPTDQQCWGDSSLYAASGPSISGNIPNTDPSAAFDTLRGTRTINFSAAVVDPGKVGAVADAWAGQVLAPITVTVSPA